MTDTTGKRDPTGATYHQEKLALRKYQELSEKMKDPNAHSLADLTPMVKDVQDQLDEPISDEHKQLIEDVVTRANNGLCVTCGEKPDYMRQVHRAMYAMPCNHRNGLGSARGWNKKWATNQPSESVHTGIDMGEIEDAIERSLEDLK